MKKYIILFLLGILIFELTFLVATKFFYSTNEEIIETEAKKFKEIQNIVSNSEIKETSYVQEKIGQNTKLVILDSYSDCEHQNESVINVDKNMINLTKEEFKKKYPEYEIKSFSRDEIKVLRKNDGICDEHFKILMGEDFIEVFKVDSSGVEELYLVTSISRDYLANEDIQKLKKGIDVYGRGNINSKLEDYE